MMILPGLLFMMTMSLGWTQVPIPTRPLGILYNRTDSCPPAYVHIDVYLDLACPDSRAAMSTLKGIANIYKSSEILIKLYMFPLPYHRNAFIASIGTQIAYSKPAGNLTGDKSAVNWIEKLFQNQISWSDSATSNMSQRDIEKKIASYSSEIGYDADTFLTDLKSNTYNWNSRVMWKYGCTKGVSGTPWYFINGIMVDAGGWTTEQMKTLIDELLRKQTVLATA